MALDCDIVLAADITLEIEEQLFALMQRCYHNVNREQFTRDLREKDRVIFLRDTQTFDLVGFSTQVLFMQTYRDSTVRIMFSGDTVIAPAWWGSMQLPLAFGRMMLEELDAEPANPLYWLLTTKGHRTYRYLPVFFKQFYPASGRTMPDHIRKIVSDVATSRFGRKFDAQRGLLIADDGDQCLRPEIARVPGARLRRDPHIRYFLERNPNYERGDELVCLVPFTRNNLRPYIRRELDRERDVDHCSV